MEGLMESLVLASYLLKLNQHGKGPDTEASLYHESDSVRRALLPPIIALAMVGAYAVVLSAVLG
jgi:hypothetical protein